MPTITKFPQEDQTNGWTRTIAPRTPTPHLKGDITADLLIIGAGYAGMGAAWTYARKRPNDRIVMLDAQVVGQGASGRNSGFVLGLKHATDGHEVTDPEPLKRLLRISQGATVFLDEIVTTHQIRCDWRKDGMYMVARGPEGLRRIGILQREFERIGEPCRVLDRKAAERETGITHYRAMLFTPNCILMQPGKLIYGLADHLPGNVTLHEQSRVTRIDYGPKVTAPYGRRQRHRAEAHPRHQRLHAGVRLFPEAHLPGETLREPHPAADRDRAPGVSGQGLGHPADGPHLEPDHALHRGSSHPDARRLGARHRPRSDAFEAGRPRGACTSGCSAIAFRCCRT